MTLLIQESIQMHKLASYHHVGQQLNALLLPQRSHAQNMHAEVDGRAESYCLDP
jgi:hypothetical protein